MRNIRPSIIALLATGAIAIASPAFATIGPGSTVTTSIQKADLETPAGVEKVYSQLQEIAEQRCEASGYATLADRQVAKSCAARLLTDFVTSADNDALTTFHQTHQDG